MQLRLLSGQRVGQAARARGSSRGAGRLPPRPPRAAPGTRHTRAPPRNCECTDPRRCISHCSRYPTHTRPAPSFRPRQAGLPQQLKRACFNNSSLNTTHPRRFSPVGLPPLRVCGGGGWGGSITHPPRLRPLSALPTHTPPLPRRLEPCPPPAAAAAVVTVAGLCAAPGSAPLRLRLVGPDKLRHCKHFYSFLGPCINRRYNPSQS